MLPNLLRCGLSTALEHFLEQRGERFFPSLSAGEPVVQSTTLDLRQRRSNFDEAAAAFQVPQESLLYVRRKRVRFRHSLLSVARARVCAVISP